MTPDEPLGASPRPGLASARALLFFVCFILGLPSSHATPGTSALVAEAWSAQQTAAGGAGHEGGRLATDSAGNLYVTGHSTYGQNFDWNIVLTQYDSSGARRWQSRWANDPGHAFATAVVVMSSNVFVAGYALNGQGNYDFVTLKYSVAGALDWARRYDGSAAGEDFLDAAAADRDGNIIVGGRSPSPTNGTDIVILKYDSAGTLLWEHRYDGRGQSDDRLAGLKVDAQGNILVAGDAAEPGGGLAIVTLKINSGGQRVWSAHHTAPGEWMAARGVAADTDGNVITVGDQGSRFLTMKHSPAGELLWTSYYHAEEPAGMVAVDVRVDRANGIVTAGNLYGSGTNDAVLVKYAPDGRQLWATRVSHSQHPFHLYAVDMDAEGNSYLTGTPHQDMLTVKIGVDGNHRWSASYSSPGVYYDIGEFITVGPNGRVFVAGRSIYFGSRFISVVSYRQTADARAPSVTVAPALHAVELGADVVFSAAVTGAEPIRYQWRFTGRPIAGATGPTLALPNVQFVHRGDYSVEVANAIASTVSAEARLTVLARPVVSVTPSYLVSFSGGQAVFNVRFSDTAPFAYDWFGTQPFTYQWRHEGTNLPGDTHPSLNLTDLTFAEGGDYSIVVSNPAGSVTSSVAPLTISAALEQLPERRYNGPGNTHDAGLLLRVTEAGEQIVAGTSTGLGTGLDIVVLKYGADGQLQWEQRFNRAAAEPDIPADLAIDPAGDIVITGASGEPYQNRVITTLKYRPDGQFVWARHHHASEALESLATSLAVDRFGQVTVAGRDDATPVVIRYSASGDQLWVGHGEAASDERNQAVVVNDAGETYLGATVAQDPALNDYAFLVRKFGPSGDVLWTRTHEANWWGEFAGMALDSAGNVVLAGSGIQASALEVVLVKFAPDGTRLWSAHRGAPPGVYELYFARTVAVDGNDEIVVAAGIEDDDDTTLGTAILKFAADGKPLWSVEDRNLQIPRGARIAVDSRRAVYVTGAAYRPDGANGIVTLKYDATGQRVWRVNYAVTGGNMDSYAVGLAAAGDVYVVAQAPGYVGRESDLLLLHYRPNDLPDPFRIGLTRQADGSYEFILPSGTQSVVESSSNLIDWTRATETELEALRQWRSPQAPPFGQRFYRLVR